VVLLWKKPVSHIMQSVAESHFLQFDEHYVQTLLLVVSRKNPVSHTVHVSASHVLQLVSVHSVHVTTEDVLVVVEGCVRKLPGKHLVHPVVKLHDSQFSSQGEQRFLPLR